MNCKRVFKPVLAILLAFFTLLGATPALASSKPDVSGIAGLSGAFERDPSVTMNGNIVSAQRYLAQIDGIGYEAYCADPGLRGPENAGAVYDVTGEANNQLRNALRNGFPINTEWSGEGDTDERMWWVYITRVAVAMANNPTRTFGGEATAVEQAQSLANGTLTANHDAYPPIMLNGNKDASDTGRTINTATAQSQAFEIAHNRKTNISYNPFRFEWAAGTPAGARLVAGGNVIAIAPANPTTVYRDNISSFHIEMPNTIANRGKTAAVNLVGIHNEYADRIWLMQNSSSPDTWQDIVFYIPPVAASAAFSFTADPDTPEPEPEPTPTPEPSESGVVIQKVDALTRENIPGALMRLRGMSSMTLVTGDGQSFTVNNTGVNISQTLTAGAQTASGEIKSTVKDGVWEIEGLPYGFYMVEEERAPENYSLLPQHTAYGFWVVPPNVTINAEGIPVINTESEIISGEGFYSSIYVETVDHIDIEFEIVLSENPTSALITFENYPFGQIEVTKYDMVTGVPLAGTHFRIQGYFAEGNTNGMPIDRVQVTGGNGKVVFANLPAGQYTISEVEAPPGYELDPTEFRSVSLTWGQSASAAFYNKPKTFVEVIKVDGDDSGKLLDGAVFRLTDPSLGEIWEGATSGGRVRLGAGSGSFGNQLVEGKLYILTEIQAPNGYVLDQSPIEVIVAADNQLNTITVRNFKKPTLTVTKYDELTGEPLSGASFRLWRAEGETIGEVQITDPDGRIVWTGLDPGIYSVQEIDEPYGYFRDPSRKEILLEGGDDKELTFFNRPRPVLTVHKRDAVTGEPLPGVTFRVHQLEGATIGEFVTDENGLIELSPQTGYLLEERIYRVTEVAPPTPYLLDANPVKDALLKWQEPTELVFENYLKPTLIFIKRDGMSGRGISGATYRVQYESPDGGITTLGSHVTKCGLIVLPYVTPGWYVLTETSPAPGYQLPTNPTVRMHLAPGQNSYAYPQTQSDLYADPRTNPNSGNRGVCGDCCGYLCSVLCAGNCGNPGGGTMSPGDGGSFGNITITNGNGEPLGGGAANPQNPGANPGAPTLSAGSATRNSDTSATVRFTSSTAGRYFFSVVNSGANEPLILTGGLGTACVEGGNTITVTLTAGAKDIYIKVKDARGAVSDALKISIPAFEAQSQPETGEPPPNFDNVVITGGTVVYLNPDFSGIVITFGNK